MGALGKLHENSYLKKEICTKKRVCKEWWGGEQEKENSKTNGMEKNPGCFKHSSLGQMILIVKKS